jgi:hypothetical protein
MRRAVVWILVLVLVLVVIGLIAYARGPEHRHGDEIGAYPSSAPILRSDLP